MTPRISRDFMHTPFKNFCVPTVTFQCQKANLPIFQRHIVSRAVSIFIKLIATKHCQKYPLQVN